MKVTKNNYEVLGQDADVIYDDEIEGGGLRIELPGANGDWIAINDASDDYGKTGHEFQAMFNAVIAARSLDGIEHVAWQPFFCRFGTWGKRQEFDDAALREAEGNIKQAGGVCQCVDGGCATQCGERWWRGSGG